MSVAAGRLWDLPGPGRFLGALRTALDAGRSVILVLPEHDGSPDPSDALAVDRLGGRRWHHLELADDGELRGTAPVSELAVALGIQPPNDGGVLDVQWLTAQDTWLQLVIRVDARRASDEALRRWSRFLTQVLAAMKSMPIVERSAVITRCRPEQIALLPEPDVLLEHAWWWGRLDRIDTTIHVERHAPTGLDPSHRAAVIEVAAHDLALADVLLDSWEGDERDLVGVLAEYATTRGWTQAAELARQRRMPRPGERVPGELVDAWSTGRLEWWSDGLAWHRAAIAADGRIGGVDAVRWLARLCWRAQVATLLPALESARLELAGFAADRQHRLRQGSRFTSVQDVEALEYGALVEYFDDLVEAARDPRRKDVLREVQAARNRLAHARTLDARRIGRVRRSLATLEGLADG